MDLKCKSLAVGLLAVSILAGCATADRGQLADIGTTAIGMRNGFVEGNPMIESLNIAQIAAIKIVVTQAVKFTPEPICTPGLWGLTTAGYGAALWNIGVMAGSGPAAIPAIAGLIWWQWDEWLLSSQRTCQDPWHFEPLTFLPVYNDMN